MMATQVLEVKMRLVAGLALLDLRGEIDGFARQALEEGYAQVESRAGKTILLNFSEVDYINSTGIALIVGLLMQARKQNRRLAAFGLSRHFEEIFNLTRLTDFIALYPDEQSAIAAEGMPA